jgi:peroxiredoxin
MNNRSTVLLPPFVIAAGAIALVSTASVGAAGKKEPLKPGVAAPVFRLRALDGAMVRLDEIAYPGREKSYAKKHPILLDFFRTDCKPCMNAMPELIGLHAKYAPQGIEVVLVALLEEQDGRGKLERYLAEKKLPFKIVLDEAEHFAKLYLGDPVTLPATFLIDETGTLRKVKYGASGTYQDYFGEEISAVIADRKGGGGSKEQK